MAAIPFIPGMPPFWIVLLDNIGLAALVAMGLVLLTGVGGLTSFGQAAFCGFGAYTTAVLTTAYGLSPWLTLPLSLLVSGVAAVLLGLVTVRLSGHYLPLGTIAWGLGLFYLFSKLEFLGRNDGISGDPAAVDRLVQDDRPRHDLFCDLDRGAAVGAADHEPAGLRAPAAPSARCGAATSPPKPLACRRRAPSCWCSSMPRCWPASPAGSMRISSAPPIRPRSARRPASNISSSRWSAAPAMSGAACSAPAIVVILKEILQSYLPYIFGGQAQLETIVFGILLVVLLQLAPTGVWPWLMARLPFKPARKRPDTSLALPARPRAAGDPVGAAADRERAKAVRRRDRRQRRLVRRPGPRDRRADRPERRRQEHHLQPDHRRALHDRRHDFRSRRKRRQRAAAGGGETRHRPHLPARQAGARHDRAGERRDRRASARTFRRAFQHAPARPRRRGATAGGSRAPDRARRALRPDRCAGGLALARPAAHRRDRARAVRRPDAAAARRAGRRPAPHGEAAARRPAAQPCATAACRCCWWSTTWAS